MFISTEFIYIDYVYQYNKICPVSSRKQLEQSFHNFVNELSISLIILCFNLFLFQPLKLPSPFNFSTQNMKVNIFFLLFLAPVETLILTLSKPCGALLTFTYLNQK